MKAKQSSPKSIGLDRGLIAVAAIVSLYNLPQLLSGSVQYDALDVHYSAQRYLSDELHAGRVPFWTPYIFSGFPFLADLQVGAWYPLNWPFFAGGHHAAQHRRRAAGQQPGRDQRRVRPGQTLRAR